MEPRDHVHLHEHCVVPYRFTAAGVEFCLVTPNAENRWEFPKTTDNGGANQPSARAQEVAAGSGLHGQFRADEPLDHFESSRGAETRSVTAFLMQVTQVDDAWRQQSTHRRIWVLAEEGRARIRRKPLRRLIDVALHAIEGKPNGVANGHTNGHSATATIR